MKKIISALCIVFIILTCFVGCGKKQEHAPVEGNILRFTNLVEDMKSLDGQRVTVTGYMSETLSEKSGIIYLMNMPCQKNPFVADNSTSLADTLAVHLRSKDDAVFTERLITVEGILTFKEHTDIRGYSYSYYLKDSTYTVADTESLDGNAKKWQKLAESGVTEEMYRMYDYLDFLCSWNSNLKQVDGVSEYLDPYTALYNIENEGAIFYYGYEEGYFDSLKEKIKALGDDCDELINNVEKAKTLAQKAYTELKNGAYTFSADGSGQYILNKGEEIKSEYNSLYSEYNSWLQGWTV